MDGAPPPWLIRFLSLPFCHRAGSEPQQQPSTCSGEENSPWRWRATPCIKELCVGPVRMLLTSIDFKVMELKCREQS